MNTGYQTTATTATRETATNRETYAADQRPQANTTDRRAAYAPAPTTRDDDPLARVPNGQRYASIF